MAYINKQNVLQAHYLPVYQPHPTNPILIGYNVWAYIGHPLLGQLTGSLQFVKTLKEARKVAQRIRSRGLAPL